MMIMIATLVHYLWFMVLPFIWNMGY